MDKNPIYLIYRNIFLFTRNCVRIDLKHLRFWPYGLRALSPSNWSRCTRRNRWGIYVYIDTNFNIIDHRRASLMCQTRVTSARWPNFFLFHWKRFDLMYSILSFSSLSFTNSEDGLPMHFNTTFQYFVSIERFKYSTNRYLINFVQFLRKCSEVSHVYFCSIIGRMGFFPLFLLI